MSGSRRWGAVVTAAGAGTRFGGPVPKQFTLLRGRPVLQWSVDLLARLMPVVVAVPGDFPWRDYWTPPEGVRVVEGGARRQDSVLAALEALDAPEWALVHDGARPWLTRALAARVMAAVEKHGAAVPGIRVRDTLKRVGEGFVESTVDREGLWMVQTPQGFVYRDLVEALRAAPSVTDESAALEKAGGRVAMVEGDPGNGKLTEPDDARLIGSAPRLSFGQGLDFHSFSPERPMVASGCRLGDSGGPSGHSDGDAVLHAAADAILAAASLGDIGTFYPPSDPAWRNVDSALILGQCMARARGAGWDLNRLDLTLIGDVPRVSPNRDRMLDRLSAILEAPRDRLWIKGTTTNGLGELGRGAGFGCLALAVLES
jgi:2-C-methyl-D-erythritol 4-phosphate cytidylyltransferase/2-C-methyl-D-erythritol 2,4-cyclodiphosphate synthase